MNPVCVGLVKNIKNVVALYKENTKYPNTTAIIRKIITLTFDLKKNSANLIILFFFMLSELKSSD